MQSDGILRPIATEKGKNKNLRCTSEIINLYGRRPAAFAATGFACPPSADNFIYGFMQN